MVEAEENDPAEGGGRCKKAGDPIDGEVRPLRLLDLEHEPHLLALRRVEHFGERRDPRSGKARVKAASGIEAANPLETKIGREAVAIRRSVDRQIVQNDRLAVGGQHDVDLDGRRAPGFRRLESRERVLGIMEAVTAVAADVDPSSLASNKAEGHARLASRHVCRDRAAPAVGLFWPLARPPSGPGHWSETLHNPAAELCNNKAR